MNSSIRIKLIVMMFLEYVIWGAWFPLLNNYIGPKHLNFDWLQGALVNDAFAIMSLTAIFFGGQLADRYFSQEKFLAFSLFVSGLALLGLSAVAQQRRCRRPRVRPSWRRRPLWPQHAGL